MKAPRFSVIIPTLNEEQFLPKLLQSLTRQTVNNFEVIVVDGNSVDKTVTAANKFTGKFPLTVIESGRTGVSCQRNLGAKRAKAAWFVFIDADSVLLPNFFERIHAYIERKRPAFFTTWLKADSDDPGEAILGFMINMSIEAEILVERPWAPGPLTVISRETFEGIGGYDEEASIAEDHDLSMAAHDKGIPFQVLREILYIYSLRRFRKEGTLKVLERNIKSGLIVALNKRGPKTMPGFVSGGLMYGKTNGKGKRKPLISKRLVRSVRKFIEELVAV